MKTEKQILRKSRRLAMLAAGVLLAGGSAFTSCSDEYDLDERTPEGWGASIYSWLDEQGNFTNTVRLIEDLGYKEVLAKTGSKTLFVADDDAYSRFYQNNSWGVNSYEQLSLSQKKLLLFGSMLDNSMQLSVLPSIQGTPPVEGECMRRFASSSVYDSVTVINADLMPDNPYWKYYRENDKSLVCMTDNSVVPLLFFIEKQLANKRITNDDYNFLFNYTTDRQPGDASVNGVKVEEGNIRCSNGFIHRMEEVITPRPNMADLIASKPHVSTYNKLLERFCAPFPDRNPDQSGSVTMRYNELYGASVDTVFTKRFFSEKSTGGSALTETPDGKAVSGTLKFDPGWNAYYAGLAGEGNTAMQKDMAVMMVPSNEAMNTYWNGEDGRGSVLKNYYGTWENVPDDVIEELLNVNMLSSFISSVPSKFNNVLNDANDPMGVNIADIDSVWLGCNGAVYLTNKVYSPTAYVSVSFPALINETMKIIDWAIEQLQYNVYLNSLNATYSFFIPTNNALLEYIDPVSYGKSKTQLYRFHYDPTKVNKSERVWASVWNYDPVTGEVLDSLERVNGGSRITNRLKDILETHIVIGNVEDGNTYYRTKGGTEIRVDNAGKDNMTVAGSYQLNESTPIRVSQIYDQSKESKGGNGKSYILESGPILGTRMTVHDWLDSIPEFSKFNELMQGSSLYEVLHNERYVCGGTNISMFNTYHYTVYVPTNESIEEMQRAGQLPTWDQVDIYEQEGNLTAKTRDSLAIENFLRYHIQDNALFFDAAPESGEYETALIDPNTKRFYRISANSTGKEILLKDNAGNSSKVIAKEGCYNLMAREYQYNGKDAKTVNQIETSSSAVIHLIDKPLSYKKQNQ